MNETNDYTKTGCASEIEDLKRQLEEQKQLHAAGAQPNRRPSTRHAWC